MIVDSQPPSLRPFPTARVPTVARVTAGVSQEGRMLKRLAHHVQPHVPAATVRPDLLAPAYAAVAAGKIDDAIDVIIDVIDDRLRAGNWDEVDAILAAANLEKLDGDTLVALLIATVRAKEHLPTRAAVAGAIATRVRKLLPKEEAEAALEGVL